jgi:hypothetical protein
MPSSPDGIHLLLRLGVLILNCRQASSIDSLQWYVSITVSLVPGLASGRFLTSGLSLPLAEASAAGSLVATGPLNGAPELSAPC